LYNLGQDVICVIVIFVLCIIYNAGWMVQDLHVSLIGVNVGSSSPFFFLF